LGALSQVIPGLSTKMPARLNVWGEEIALEGGVFRQWLPYKASTEKKDIVEDALKAVEYYPGLPAKDILINGVKVEIPDNLYRDYSIMSGSKAYTKMKELVSKPAYAKLPKKIQEKWLKNIFNYSRREARVKVIQKLKSNNLLKDKTGG